MSFNLKKLKKKSKKEYYPNQPYPKRLVDQQKDWDHSIGEKTETYQGLLYDNRGEGQGENLDKVTDYQMSTNEKGHEYTGKSEDSRVTESQMTKSDSSIIQHRDPEVNDHIMKPMDAIAEGYDEQYRDTFAQYNTDSDTEYWDKMIGVQLERDPHMIQGRMPDEASQLHNHPSRFKDVDTPATGSVIEKDDNQPYEPKNITKMESASVQDIDKELFKLFYLAASENRDLTEKEAQVVTDLSTIKAGMLERIQEKAAG